MGWRKGKSEKWRRSARPPIHTQVALYFGIDFANDKTAETAPERTAYAPPPLLQLSVRVVVPPFFVESLSFVTLTTVTLTAWPNKSFTRYAPCPRQRHALDLHH